MYVDSEHSGLRLRKVRRWASSSRFVHGFTDRHGGVSETPFASLNIGLHVGDNPDAVRTNRARIWTAFQREPEHVVAAEQVHGNRVAVVTAADKGRGARSTEDAIPEADALVTNVSGLLLVAFFADCVPILLYDPSNLVVGVVHAGWKGTAANVVGEAVRVMSETFGAQPAQIEAAIGPSIGVCCYAVGHEVADRINRAVAKGGPIAGAEENGAEMIVQHRNAQPYANLALTNYVLLRQAGLAHAKVFVDDTCTRCRNDRFFSHRGDGGTTGRFAAVIGRNER